MEEGNCAEEDHGRSSDYDADPGLREERTRLEVEEAEADDP